MPARVSLLNELEEFQVRPLSIFKDELLTVAYAAPGGPGGAIYAEIVGDLMLDIAQGADIEAAVDAAVTELDAQLAQFRIVLGQVRALPDCRSQFAWRAAILVNSGFVIHLQARERPGASQGPTIWT